MEHIENAFFKPSKIVSIIIYLVMIFLGSSIILMIAGLVYTSLVGSISFDQLLEIMSSSDLEKLTPEETSAYAMVNSIGNMLSYLLMMILINFFMRDCLKTDAKVLKQNYKFYIWFIPLCAALFFGITFVVNEYIVSPNVGTSDNQSSIVLMIQNGGAVYMFIAVVICAPLVEELIYRKAIFSLLDKKPIWISYLVSSIAFTLPHMFTTNALDFGRWLLLCVPYFLSAVLFAVIYQLSKKNVFSTYFAHMINNLISFIFIIQQM